MPIINNLEIQSKQKVATKKYFWESVKKVFSIEEGTQYANLINSFYENDPDRVINVDYVLTQSRRINTSAIFLSQEEKNLQGDFRLDGDGNSIINNKVATIEYTRRVVNCLNSCSRSCTSCSGGCSSCVGCIGGCQSCQGCQGCQGCYSCQGCTSCTSCVGGCQGCMNGPCNCDCPCQGPCSPCNDGGSGTCPCSCAC